MDLNRDGRISLGEIRNNSLADLADVSLTGSLAADLPITASIGSFSATAGAAPRILVTDEDLFGGPAPDVTFEDFEQILDFSAFDGSSILAMLRSLSDRLAAMGQTAAFNFELPFTDKRLGDALDFGLDFVDTLTGIGGDPTFSGAQSLATQLAAALGISPAIVNPEFNVTMRELTFTIDYSKAVSAQAGFAFNAALIRLPI